jgi:SAM-dependent methyltransferase
VRVTAEGAIAQAGSSRRRGAEAAGRASEPWQLRLYRRSIKKKETLRAFLRLLPDVAGRRCLEVGCGSGTSGWLFRAHGGSWVHADSDAGELTAAKRFLGTGVCRIDRGRLPFRDGAFDVVVAINLIRDVADDRSFALDLTRVLAAGGHLLVNAPEGSPGRAALRLRRLYGLSAETLAAYGDARDGYRRADLEALLQGSGLEVEAIESYSGLFTEFVENSLKTVYYRAERRRREVAERHPAGTWNVTADHFTGLGWRFRAFGFAYPVLRGVSLLDRLLPSRHGNMLCVRAVKPAPDRRPGL